MKTKRILPIAAVVAAMIGASAAVVTAQDADTQAQTAPQVVQPVDGEAQAGPRGDHGPRHGKRGPEGVYRVHGDRDHDSRHERGDRDRDRGERHGHGPRGGMFGPRGGSEMMISLFNQVDADGDKTVTQDEIDTFRAAKVGEVDASGDGALSIEEFDTLYREFTRSRMVDMFQDFDADGDGVISPEEMDARFGGVVDRMDRDGDGVLKLQPRKGG